MSGSVGLDEVLVQGHASVKVGMKYGLQDDTRLDRVEDRGLDSTIKLSNL